MIETVSYVKYISDEISDFINFEICDKTFTKIKKLNFKRKKDKKNK